MPKTGRLKPTDCLRRHRSGARDLLAVPGTCSFTVPHDNEYGDKHDDDDTCTTSHAC
jgi:hypothetical protein